MRSNTSNRIIPGHADPAPCKSMRAGGSPCEALHAGATHQVTGSAPFHFRGFGARPSVGGGSRLPAEVPSLLVDLVELVEGYKHACQCSPSRPFALIRNNRVGTGSTESRPVLGSSGRRGAADHPAHRPRHPITLRAPERSSNHREPVRTGAAIPSLRVGPPLALPPAPIFPDLRRHGRRHARKPACSGVHNHARSGAITAIRPSVPSGRDGRSVGVGRGSTQKPNTYSDHLPSSRLSASSFDSATC